MCLDLHWVSLDKAPRLSIRIVIWILPSDTVFVNSIKISANNETAMLSRFPLFIESMSQLLLKNDVLQS